MISWVSHGSVSVDMTCRAALSDSWPSESLVTTLGHSFA